MNALYTATAVATGGRSGHVEVQNSTLQFDMSPPPEMGGTKPGNNPEQLFAAGYAACFGSAMQHAVRVRKLHIPAPDVRLTVGIDKDASGGFYLSAEIVGIVKGVDKSLADELVREAHTVCPYSKATMGNIKVTLLSEIV
jgi:lipoyl-dependent peroxiredoxin